MLCITIIPLRVFLSWLTAHSLIHYLTLNGRVSGNISLIIELLTDTATILNSVVLSKILWDARGGVERRRHVCIILSLVLKPV